MHWDERVGLELFDVGEHLLEVVGRRRPEMKPADYRVNFLDTRNLLRLPHRIDDADVPAGADHHQSLAADVEASCVLMHVLVRYHLPLQLRRGVVAVVAARALFAGVVHKAVRQHALAAVALDLASGEGMVGDNGWRFAEHCRHLVGLDLAALERAVLAQLPGRGTTEPMAEIVLASSVELQVRRKHAAVLAEETDEAAVMVDMT